jgi:hypothetical protein
MNRGAAVSWFNHRRLTEGWGYIPPAEAEELVLLTLYSKAKTDNLTGAVLKEIRRALED